MNLKLNLKLMAAVAATGASAALFGADLGRYMLPDADLVLVSVSDRGSRGGCSRALEASGSKGLVDQLLETAVAKAKDPARAKAALAKFGEYAGLLGRDAVRVETAVSAKAVPGKLLPDVRFSAAIAGLSSPGEALARAAAEFPDALGFDGGVLKSRGAGVQAWVEDGVLRLADVRTPRTAAAASVYRAGSPFGRLLARTSGKPFFALRIGAPADIFRRFASPEQIRAVEGDPNLAGLLKVRMLGFEVAEDDVRPVLHERFVVRFDGPDAAQAAADRVKGLKALDGLAVRVKGDRLVLPLEVDAQTQIDQLRKQLDAWAAHR